MIAAIYARKSSDEPGRDAEDASCPTQIDRAREFAKAKGWRVDEGSVFRDDGVSGSEFSKRHGLQTLLAALKPTPRFKVLIVRNESRLGRDYRRTVALGVQFEDAGVEVWGYQDNERLLYQDDVGEMKNFIKGKSDERRLIDDSKNTREGQAKVAGKRHVGGKLYGYARVKTGELNKREHPITKRVIDPAQAKIVREVFEMRARGMGFPTIADKLNARKIPSPRADSLVKRDGKKVEVTGLWSGQAVAAMTKNEHYAGRVQWGRTRSKKIAKAAASGFDAPAIDRRDETLRIISPKLWREVKRVNEAAEKTAWRRPGGQFLSRPTGKYWVTRHVRCGACNGSMSIRWLDEGGERKGFLICVRRSNGKFRCTNTRRLRVEVAERAIMDRFEKALVPAAVIAKVEEWQKLRRGAKSLGKEDRAKLERERDALDRRIKKAVAASLVVDAPEEYKAEIEGTKLMKQTVEDKLRGAEVLHSFDPEVMADAVEAITKDWRKQLKRDPDVIGQVLAKLLHEKLNLYPPKARGGEWSYEAEVDFTAVLREADEDKAAAMEALARELDLDVEDVRKAGDRRKARGTKDTRTTARC